MAVKITGLREFQAKLRVMDARLPREIRVVLNGAADLVVEGARPLVPRRTGRAAASLKAASSQREARVAGGSGRAPYYPWLDFGGRVGRHNSIGRPFMTKGRYLFPTYEARRGEVLHTMQEGLIHLAVSSGVDVD